MAAVFKKVAIGCDHAAVATREALIKFLTAQGVDIVDCGTKTPDRVDYPDVAKAVCSHVAGDASACGILICGSGIGMSISANKVPGIRAAVCHDHYTALMTRKHNNANVLCLGARVTGPDVLQQMTEVFVTTDFEGGRHAGRVDKIVGLEEARPTVAYTPPTDNKVASLVIGCDHAAFEAKNDARDYLKSLGYEVEDCGVHSPDRVDYPDIAAEVCKRVLATPGARGVLMCGSGMGIMISANKVPGIRAAVAFEAYTATMARQHNDANVLCMGARTSGPELHKAMLKAYLEASFEGGRHTTRVGKIEAVESRL
eukprot:TRINITY_DN9304_c0_g5_i1.p2 TRINITY_DN9304_c0_g5~~TRINITY_DN9304_c0_g5_i1.p2  ORF type:complete len:313 (+),score=108.95 TRINITY_DN9304_c0_g5_i1:48-986(+)